MLACEHPAQPKNEGKRMGGGGGVKQEYLHQQHRQYILFVA